MITIWGRTTSSNVQTVMWAIAELGLEHERIDAGGPFGGLDTPEFAAMNPNRLVPVLRDGGQYLWESASIARYLGGGKPCFADCVAGTLLYRYFTLEIERADLPNLKAYYDRLTERPAYARHVMISYDYMRAK